MFNDAMDPNRSNFRNQIILFAALAVLFLIAVIIVGIVLL